MRVSILVTAVYVTDAKVSNKGIIEVHAW